MVDVFADGGPDASIFSGEHTKGALGGFCDGGIGSVVDNCLEIEGHVVFSHDEVIVFVQDVEPVKLGVANDDNVV